VASVIKECESSSKGFDSTPEVEGCLRKCGILSSGGRLPTRVYGVHRSGRTRPVALIRGSNWTQVTALSLRDVGTASRQRSCGTVDRDSELCPRVSL
jgi:hypothetical protein